MPPSQLQRLWVSSAWRPETSFFVGDDGVHEIVQYCFYFFLNKLIFLGKDNFRFTKEFQR